MTSIIDELVTRARDNRPHLANPEVAAPPRRKVAVLTCMDARILPERLLSLQPGDVHVLRNAGGIVTEDVLRSLILSQVALGTEAVMVIQHTRCGVEGLDDEEMAERVRRERGVEPGLAFGGFADVEESVRASVQRLSAEPWLRGEVRGFVYRVETGELVEVET